jgi:hypothetical protein
MKIFRASQSLLGCSFGVYSLYAKFPSSEEPGYFALLWANPPPQLPSLGLKP